MSQVESPLFPQEARLTSLWSRMVTTVGIHTVNVLFERAIWEVSEAHPELALIERSDKGLVFTAVEQAYPAHELPAIATAFDDLMSQLLLILTRLLGEEMAERVAAELTVKPQLCARREPEAK
jgi:hypothetical protein